MSNRNPLAQMFSKGCKLSRILPILAGVLIFCFAGRNSSDAQVVSGIHIFTGVIQGSPTNGSFVLTVSPQQRLLVDDHRAVIQEQSKRVDASLLRAGIRVSVTGSLVGQSLRASRITILPSALSLSPQVERILRESPPDTQRLKLLSPGELARLKRMPGPRLLPKVLRELPPMSAALLGAFRTANLRLSPHVITLHAPLFARRFGGGRIITFGSSPLSQQQALHKAMTDIQIRWRRAKGNPATRKEFIHRLGGHYLLPLPGRAMVHSPINITRKLPFAPGAHYTSPAAAGHSPANIKTYGIPIPGAGSGSVIPYSSAYSPVSSDTEPVDLEPGPELILNMVGPAQTDNWQNWEHIKAQDPVLTLPPTGLLANVPGTLAARNDASAVYATPSTSVVLHVLCSFTDDSSLNGNRSDDGMGGTFFAGNHGHYEAKLQVLELDDNGQTIYDTSGHPKWDDQPVGAADLYGPDGGPFNSDGQTMVGDGVHAIEGGTASQPFSLVAKLPQIGNIVRFAYRYYLGETVDNGNGWDIDNAKTGESKYVDGYQTTEPANYDMASSSQGWDYSPPFEIVVLPSNLVQLKYMPITILYEAPGDQSQVQYATTDTFTTRTTYEQTLGSSFKTGTENMQQIGVNFGLSAQNVVPGLGVTAGVSISSTWSNDTTNTSGSDQGNADTVADSYSLAIAEKLPYSPGQSGLPPNDNESWLTEPFWADQIVISVHPQLAIWDYAPTSSDPNSGPALQGVQSMGSADQRTVSVALLADALSSGTFDNSQVQLPETLTLAECAQLLSLDPFYVGQWQGWPGITSEEGNSGSFPTLAVATGGRAAWITSSNFGLQKSSHGSSNPGVDVSTQVENESDSKASSDQYFDSTVESKFTLQTSSNLGITFAPSLSAGITNTAQSTQSQTSDLKVEFKTTQEKDLKTAVTATGNLANSGSNIVVCIYRDLLFGGLMFHDDKEQAPIRMKPPMIAPSLAH